MAVSERIKAEAQRTIDGMQRFYDKYGEPGDAEELEHRIARIDAAMEGCNGLTQEEKIQKTAENVFELACSQERSYDSIMAEVRRTREENREEFSAIRAEIKSGLDGIMRKIEDSGCDSSRHDGHEKGKYAGHRMLFKLISDHPMLAFEFFVFLLVMVFVSGHFDAISKMIGGS